MRIDKIPRTIHYCWLSNEKLPSKLEKCIESWKTNCPDYEIINWNFDRLGSNCPIWVTEAFEKGKYAFAADWVRAYVLYNYGGIYLDSDVEVLKSFDPLLNNDYFLSFQANNDQNGIEAAVMGAKKGLRIFELLLSYYENRHFIKPDNTLDTLELPYIIESVIKDKIKLVKINNPSEIDNSFSPDESMFILPADYFSPKSFIDGKIYLTNNTYAIHHFSGSWLPPAKRIYKNLLNTFGYKVTKRISKVVKRFIK